MKTRIIELDYVRVMSMLAIITLHVTSTFIFSVSRFSPAGMNIAFILNQLARFAVPLFILLSGISLGYGKSDEPPLKFYSTRLLRTAILYLVWYSVYFIYNISYTDYPCTYYAYFVGLLRGFTAPQLYFMVIIIQLYILFPLLIRLLKKYRNQTLIITFILSFYFQLGIYLKYFGLHIIPGSLETYSYILFPTWIFYFTAGIFIAKDKLAVLSKKAIKYLPVAFAATIILGLLFALEGKINETYELSIKPQLFIYTGVVFVFLFGLGTLCSRFTVLNKAATFLSKRSMTIYFVHVLILYIFRLNNVFQKGLSGMFMLLLSVTVLSVIASTIIDALVALIKRGVKKRRIA